MTDQQQTPQPPTAAATAAVVTETEEEMPQVINETKSESSSSTFPKKEETNVNETPPELSGDLWLAAQTQKVFDGIAALAASELKATSDEFQLLEQINRVASAKYAELSDTVESLESVSKELIEQRKLNTSSTLTTVFFNSCKFMISNLLSLIC
jgi:hypothetical protein